jgi:hypothetical protein
MGPDGVIHDEERKAGKNIIGKVMAQRAVLPMMMNKEAAKEKSKSYIMANNSEHLKETYTLMRSEFYNVLRVAQNYEIQICAHLTGNM